MKAGVVVCGPDVACGPLALLSGTFAQKARKAADMGYDGIELMVRDPVGLDWPAIKSTVASAGLEVCQVVTGELFGADGLCLVTADDALRQRAEERTRDVIDLAAYLGAMVNVGRLRGRLELLGQMSDPWSFAVDQLCRIADYAAARQVSITIEPINRYETDYVLSAADGLRLIQMMGRPNVGLMLDLFHMNIEDESIEQGLRCAGDRLWHVHIADSNRCYPGSGHLNFDPIFATLKEMGYQGYVSAELRPLPDPDTAALKTIDFLKPRLSG